MIGGKEILPSCIMRPVSPHLEHNGRDCRPWSLHWLPPSKPSRGRTQRGLPQAEKNWSVPVARLLKEIQKLKCLHCLTRQIIQRNGGESLKFIVYSSYLCCWEKPPLAGTLQAQHGKDQTWIESFIFSPNKTCHRHCHCQILLKYPRSLWINQEVVFGFKCCCPEKIFTCLPVVQKGQTVGGMSGRSRSLSMKCGCSSSQWSSQIEWPGKFNLISISSLLHANPLTSPLFHLRLLFSSIASLDR